MVIVTHELYDSVLVGTGKQKGLEYANLLNWSSLLQFHVFIDVKVKHAFLKSEHSRLSSVSCAKRTSWRCGALSSLSSPPPPPPEVVSTVSVTSSGRKWCMSKTALRIGRPSRSSTYAVSTGLWTPSARCSSVDFITRKSLISSRSFCKTITASSFFDAAFTDPFSTRRPSRKCVPIHAVTLFARYADSIENNKNKSYKAMQLGLYNVIIMQWINKSVLRKSVSIYHENHKTINTRMSSSGLTSVNAYSWVFTLNTVRRYISHLLTTYLAIILL